MGVLDDDNVLLDEMDERIRDFRRIGSFFQPWFYTTQEDPNYKSITNHFYTDKLKQKCEGINWTNFDKYIRSNGINIINHHSYVAHYLSLLVINQLIISDELYDGLANDNLKYEFSYKLDGEKENILNIIDDCYDHEALPDLKAKLYISKNNYNGEHVLDLFIEHLGYGMSTRLTFNRKEEIK